MKKGSVILLAAIMAAGVAGGAQAQVCAGFPTVDRQFTFGARMDFPEGGDQFGVEASYNFSGPLAFFGGLDVVSPEGSDEDDNIFFGGLALEIPALAMLGSGISVCPVGEVRFQDVDNGSRLQFPLGVGLGGSLAAGPGVSLSPYVIPQLVITRFDYDDDIPLLEDETETEFGIRGGALLGFGMFFVGGEVRHIFRDPGPDPTFGIRAGIRL